MSVCLFVHAGMENLWLGAHDGVELWCSCEDLCKYNAAFSTEQSWVYIPRNCDTSYYSFCTTHHCLLHMKSFSVSLCLLLSLCCVFNVPACINVSLPPYRLLIYEFYRLVCHYCLQKGALMDQYVESVTRRIASCPQTSWIFFWQPVACSISDLDDILRCYKKF